MYTEQFEAYKRAVVLAYLEKSNNAFEDWLIRPTRAKIRQQYIQLAENGLEHRDAAVLRSFLEIAETDDLLLALKRKDAEDFRAIENFLRNTDIVTSEKNVGMLAVLIGFPERPFSQFKKNSDGQPVKKIKGRVEEVEGGGWRSDPVFRLLMPSKTWLWVAGLVTIGVVLLVVFKHRFAADCMYWKDDHYIATPCAIPRKDTPFVALDGNRLRGFRKLGRCDTLTEYAVGKFWYARIADTIEIYSEGGNHPLYPNKQLKKVTDYVINVCHNRRRQ